MAQAFVTTTKNSFRWNVQEKVKPIRHEHKFDECYGKNIEWLTEQDLNEKMEKFEKIKASVAQLKRDRMSRTTYRIDYCKHEKKAARTVGSEDSFENQLQERYYKKIYQKKKGKILPTVETQRIFGFLAPSRMYTQKSNYQHDYGQVGFDRLFNGNIP
ncbi:uncharacterized protein LOC114333394 [Diabrotica virgifera virgifera]|uniref:Uncharacterized protein n=1 Tax=Diabrotica virgifera virgifera TaxID=50390 RepID=A0ABM5KTY4_DIAVI|nr:uncharacterized protein LOC114333394 [Diabrotica virgifera virgifera]